MRSCWLAFACASIHDAPARTRTSASDGCPGGVFVATMTLTQRCGRIVVVALHPLLASNDRSNRHAGFVLLSDVGEAVPLARRLFTLSAAHWSRGGSMRRRYWDHRGMVCLASIGYVQAMARTQ
ncbi:hypothetical protein OH77DRAFT_619811 [Trametes cingulata]|nr:hypothetical protein OH77DRAFT_619811 [Trametes cingulata]